MTSSSATSRLDTHEVTNQATPLCDYNTFDSDPALQAAVEREGAKWAESRIRKLGAEVGSAKVQELASLANKFTPELFTNDRYGHRLDEVEYHPAYHELMSLAFGSGIHSLAWTATEPGGHVARAAMSYLWNQGENGIACPIAMTYAALPAVRAAPSVAEDWAGKLMAEGYDHKLRPIEQKQFATMGMVLTEKQSGCDLRGITTTASSTGVENEYLLNGHKWFCSAPMCDGFLAIAYTDAGPTLFLLPRVLSDGTRNRIFIQMLKDKCGNRSNASSSVELHDAFAIRISEEGRGIRMAMEDAHLSRLDLAVGSAGLMRQALVQALHYGRGRRTFQMPLASQPLMQNVLADLAIESEAAMVLTMRIARAVDEAPTDPIAAKLQRVGPPLVKYFVCKTAPGFVVEAMECLGGNGYIENHMLARLYREAPVNSIWEGSSNMVCLDVLRSLDRDPEMLDAMMSELRAAKGGDRMLDAAVEALPEQIAQIDDLPHRARWISERMVRLWQGALMIRHATPSVADAFLSTRVGEQRGEYYGSMRAAIDCAAILDQTAPADDLVVH